MTIVEAGQVILEGNKWVECLRCGGNGEVSPYDRKDWKSWVACRSCKGKGKEVRLEWELAVNRLDMEEG